MPFSRLSLSHAAVLSLTLLLAGCENSEERAQRHFDSGMTLLQAGDFDRAAIEFRNVFKYNNRHKEARETYARLQRDRGAIGEAYGQYLRLVEQYPDTPSARLALAQMAIDAGNWEEADRHGRAARDLTPDDADVLLVNAALDYREASLARDRGAARAPLAIAEQRLTTEPGNLIALRMVIDNTVTGGDMSKALPILEAALQERPEQYDFHGLRLRVLAETQDIPAIGVALKEAVAQFPDNLEVRRLLIAWYLDQQDLEGAETFLRQLAEKPDAGIAERTVVVDFLMRTSGREAARAELERLIAAGPHAETFRAMRATMQFEDGDTGAAISEMESLVAAQASSEEVNNFKIILARMHLVQGNLVGARARVEEVLAQDPSHVEALKMQSGWLIEEDKPGEAIAALRTALAQAPRDAGVLTLMARAHERDGARELAGERFALAFEASGRAAPEALRLVRFLIGNDRIDTAESVLTEALAVNPGDLRLLEAMAEVHLRRGDWDRTTRIVWQLRAIDTPESVELANALEARRLLRQDRMGETISFLEGIVNSGDSSSATIAMLVQSQVRDGRIDGAKDLLDEALARTPADPTLRFLRAGLHVLSDEPAEAEAIYRALNADYPAAEQPLRVLVSLLLQQGREADADALIDSAIAANPGGLAPKVIRANRLEQARDFEGAIAVYETLYAANSANLVIANNLASLITTHRDDAESLDRAFSIARRLRGAEVPAFQDTYGWIEYRRGNHDEALSYLEPAARGLPDDPLVQFHLGMTYHALNRRDEARETLSRALELAGENPLPQFDRAREVLAEPAP